MDGIVIHGIYREGCLDDGELRVTELQRRRRLFRIPGLAPEFPRTSSPSIPPSVSHETENADSYVVVLFRALFLAAP